MCTVGGYIALAVGIAELQCVMGKRMYAGQVRSQQCPGGMSA